MTARPIRDRLAEEAGRRKAAEQQQILYLRPRGRVGRSGDNAVVVHLARIVDADLDHHRAVDGAGLIAARAFEK
jgi:hypothetical protein